MYKASSLQLLGQFQTNFIQSIYLVKGLQICSNEGPCENILTKFKTLVLQNLRANFKQTWHKGSFGDGDSSFTNKNQSIFRNDI